MFLTIGRMDMKNEKPSRELKTPGYLPSSRVIDRLEEYQFHENIAYLLIGTFGGAILDILTNWAISDPSILMKHPLLLVYVAITTFCVVWALILRKRLHLLRERVLHHGKAKQENS